ncbi:MAG TPA: hypothetical protein GXX75_25815 [Clostridiales bacterium]|nr:hypothetical protein [Clostridiales bacterium]
MKVKRLIGIIMVTIMFTMFATPAQKVDAAGYIKVNEFVKLLVMELGLEVDESKLEPHIEAAKAAGILKEGDFKKYTGNLTREDLAVLANRADEYLNGDTVKEKLINTILEKRISDISSVAVGKRKDVAKVMAKGIIIGYGNGTYSQDRAFKGKGHVTPAAAKSVISLVLDPEKRAKISPDGQLIRTTNLPKYEKYYPYILASFPNQYYDWKFSYEGQAKVNPRTDERIPYVYLEEYASPKDIDKITDFDDFKSVREEYLDLWVQKAKTYAECVFNADYRTIDDKWANTLLSADYSYGHDNLVKREKESIKQYIKDMKANRTVIESSKIAVDGSSLYYFDGVYTLRVYVKYRVLSSKVGYGVDTDTLIMENPYGKILYTRYPIVCLRSYTIGKWKESYFDVELGWYANKSPDNIGIFYAVWDELLYDKRRVD